MARLLAAMKRYEEETISFFSTLSIEFNLWTVDDISLTSEQIDNIILTKVTKP